MGKVFVCVAIGCALLAYMLNPSVPDGIEESWKYRTLAATFKFYHLVVSSHAYIFVFLYLYTAVTTLR